MKKFSLYMVCCSLMFLMLVNPVSAYDFREDKIEDAENADEIYGIEPYVLDDLEKNILSSVNENVIQSIATQGEVLFDDGVHVYNFELGDFITALRSDMRAALESHEWVVWEVPVNSNSQMNEFTTIVNKDDFTTSWSENQLIDKAYLTDPDVIDDLLESKTFDSVYITAVPTWTVSFVTVLSGDDVELAPFAYNAEWMRLENKSWYTAEELADKLVEFQDSMEVSGDSGGGTGLSNVQILWNISIFSGVAFLFMVFVLWKRRRDN